MTFEQALCPEILKLKQLLKDAGIEYTCPDSRSTNYAMARVQFKIGKHRWSCIHGDGSYGGEYGYGADHGLLELLQLDGQHDAQGYMTAEEVARKVGLIKED